MSFKINLSLKGQCPIHARCSARSEARSWSVRVNLRRRKQEQRLGRGKETIRAGFELVVVGTNATC
ncbi:hypothetical protein BDV35DRAFT_349444 [Aspergillus flavus]|uniref:Uncharacterized protein n=1 Tax=Aspergillus flavus TaxID=5059 RepID=A0A5N6H0E5_ASPFL|nr:hypothetical protein BDV35DRAFT_349444 [Aspergillus flavus]